MRKIFLYVSFLAVTLVFKPDAAAQKPAFRDDENADILHLKHHILIVEDERIN